MVTLKHKSLKNLFRFILCLTLFPCSTWVFAGQEPEALTLQKCFSVAKQYNELLKIQNENIFQSEQRYKQALAGILPDFRFKYSKTYRDAGSSAFSGEGTESKFTLSQSLFDGFRRKSAIDYSVIQKRIEEILYNNIVRGLYFDTARAFYSLARIEADNKNVGGIAKLLSERVGELNERVRLGKSRESEVLLIESQIEVYNSQVAQIDGNRKAALEALSFLTGVDSHELKINDDTPEIKEAEPVEKALEAIMKRSDIKALKEESAAQAYRVKIAKGAFLPGIALDGSKYIQREGIIYSGISWDVILSLNFPLYQGGFDRSRLKEEMSRLREIDEQTEQLVRRVKTQVKTLHSSLVSSLATVTALKEAYSKAGRSYQSQLNEYRLGLVNNLDVLQSVRILLDVKRSLDNAIIDAKTNKVLLDIEAERIP